jgi:hypothetical protein
MSLLLPSHLRTRLGGQHQSRAGKARILDVKARMTVSAPLIIGLSTSRLLSRDIVRPIMQDGKVSVNLSSTTSLVATDFACWERCHPSIASWVRFSQKEKVLHLQRWTSYPVDFSPAGDTSACAGFQTCFHSYRTLVFEKISYFLW